MSDNFPHKPAVHVIPTAEAPPMPRPSILSNEENAEWDRLLSHEELVKQAEINPPPQSWYEEEFIR